MKMERGLNGEGLGFFFFVVVCFGFGFSSTQMLGRLLQPIGQVNKIST